MLVFHIKLNKKMYPNYNSYAKKLDVNKTMIANRNPFLSIIAYRLISFIFLFLSNPLSVRLFPHLTLWLSIISKLDFLFCFLFNLIFSCNLERRCKAFFYKLPLIVRNVCRVIFHINLIDVTLINCGNKIYI